ncbi:MAG: class I SAM-dependent methyltransferase [Actinomycetota bacterium]
MSEPISTYYGLLRRIHELRQPSLYVEIGVHEGHSLAFVQPGTRIVGIDPAPKVAEPPADTTIVAETSDDFFADPAALLGAPIDLAFADGLHHWEQTLRDVANLERHCSPDSVILIHDCNPIDEVTAARERTTAVWSGDVWKTIVALRRFRPDLNVVVADVEPTGLAIVTGLDPSNTVLFDRYDEIVADIDQLGWADVEAADRSDLLGLVPGDWTELRPLVA